jgi:hypothetical protein
VLCYTTSPHGPIPPPIKRAMTLASGVVVIVISVKFVILILVVDAKLVAEQGRILPENSRFPTSSNQPKVAAINHHFRLFTTGLSLPVFSSSLSLLAFHICAFHCFVLCLKQRTASIQQKFSSRAARDGQPVECTDQAEAARAPRNRDWPVELQLPLPKAANRFATADLVHLGCNPTG